MNTDAETRDFLAPYHKFDDWTQRTGILNGGGLTWLVRIPLNVLFVIVLFGITCVIWIVDKVKETD